MTYDDCPNFEGQLRLVKTKTPDGWISERLQQAYDRGGPYEVLEWRDIPEVQDAPSR